MYQLTSQQKLQLANEVRFQYSRSSGPGGQKVNKTETRAEAHWNYQASAFLSEEQKSRIALKLANRINKNLELIVYSDQFRTRPANQKQCMEILVMWIEKALTVPRPRKKTKPTRSSIEKRLTSKKRMADKKRNRQRI